MTPNTFTLLGARPLLGQLFEPGDTSWYGERMLPDPHLGELLAPALRRRPGDHRTPHRHQPRARASSSASCPRSFDFPMRVGRHLLPRAGARRRSRRSPRAVQRDRPPARRHRPARRRSRAERARPELCGRFPAITPDMLQRSRARVSVEPLKAATVAAVRPQLVLLGVLVALVLLIATTNVVNLFLLRTERASHEIAIALSLGASRVALAQRFVVEGIVLGLASAIVALPVAALALSTKFGFTEREIPRLHEVSFTWETAALVLACATLIGGAVGLIALTRTGMAGLFDRLRASRTTSSRSMAARAERARRVPGGDRPRAARCDRPARPQFLEPAQCEDRVRAEERDDLSGVAAVVMATVRTPTECDFHAKMVDRLAALPGVTSAAVALRLPLAGRGASSLDLQLQAGDEEGTRPRVAAFGNMASADYFRVMGIPLRAGRSFRSGDLRGTPAVIVSERLAKSMFRERRTSSAERSRNFSSAGRHCCSRSLASSATCTWNASRTATRRCCTFRSSATATAFRPTCSAVPGTPMDVQYVIRGTQLPTASTIQEIVKELDRRVPATNIRTLGSLVDDATARVRLTMLLIAIAGVAALLLGVIGVYSVVAYAANGRMREFGIRLALGAAPARVGGLVLGDGLRSSRSARSPASSQRSV